MVLSAGSNATPGIARLGSTALPPVRLTQVAAVLTVQAKPAVLGVPLQLNTSSDHCTLPSPVPTTTEPGCSWATLTAMIVLKALRFLVRSTLPVACQIGFASAVEAQTRLLPSTMLLQRASVQFHWSSRNGVLQSRLSMPALLPEA